MKQVLVPAILAILAILLTSCERNSEPKVETPETVDVVTLTLALSSETGNAELQTAQHFAHLVNISTQGDISVDVTPATASTLDRKFISQVQQGELDIVIVPSSKLSHLAPRMQILDLPYLFKDQAAALRVYQSHAGRTLLSSLNVYGLEGLAFLPGGFKQLVTSYPFVSHEDFQQRRFNTMESSVIREQFDAWGSNTVAIAAHQSSDAFAQNAIDGSENTFINIAKIDTPNLQVTETNHGFLSFVLVMSSKTLKSLPPVTQTALLDALEASYLHHQTLVNDAQEKAYALVSEQRVVMPASPSLVGEMEKTFFPLLERNRMAFGTELVEQVLQARENWSDVHPDALVVALDADLQGGSALSGVAIRRGIELALDEINQQGGLLGKQVKLVARNNSMVPSRGLDNLEVFASMPNLLAVFGGISSPVMLAQLDYIHNSEVLMLAPWAAATPIIDSGRDPNFVFRVSVRDEYAAEFLLKGALDVSDKIGLLLVNNGWGRSNYEGLWKEMTTLSLEPVHLEWFHWGETELDAKIQQLVDKGVEVIIYVGNAVEGEKLLSALSAQPNPPVVISHWGITGSQFARNAAASLKKVDLRVLQTFSFIDNDSPTARSLASRYHQKYFTSSAQDIFAPSGTAHAYDLMHMLAQATRQANEASMVRIRQEMKKINKYKGIIKDYQNPFKQQNDALNAKDYTFARYENGKLHPLEQDRE